MEIQSVCDCYKDSGKTYRAYVPAEPFKRDEKTPDDKEQECTVTKS